MSGVSLDNLIRSTLQSQVMDTEPAASVRDSLLAEAAHVRARSAIGPSIPPAASGLREQSHAVQSALPIRLPIFSGQVVAEQWLMMIAPLYAIR